jgi:hypothetical protein
VLKNIILGVLFIATIFGNFQTAFAKSQNDWSRVVSSTNDDIAVKTSGGKTVFGKLTSANDSQIIVQTASKKELTNQSVTIQKNEVKKVWLAKLRFGKNPALATGIGAAVGGGIGAGLALGLLAATGGSDGTSEIIGAFTAVGAGAGAGLGFLVGRQSHKKQAVIYEI